MEAIYITSLSLTRHVGATAWPPACLPAFLPHAPPPQLLASHEHVEEVEATFLEALRQHQQQYASSFVGCVGDG